jgi:trk system potassium uptake protein TrkH
MNNLLLREAAHLRRRYKAILSCTGMILALCAGLMLVPLLAVAACPGEGRQVWAFATPALLMGGLGAALWRRSGREDVAAVSVQEAGVVVLLSWLLVCLFSAWPFMAVAGLGFTQAVFEAVSGWTTTGLSVVNVEEASHAILLWRSLMQLAGGAGLAIIMLSAITGPTGPALSDAEGREQLVPHVRKSAKLVMLIYGVNATVGAVALRWAGMEWFDAINHSFAAISTGGFSTRADSIGHWSSTTVEAVTVALMVLGNLSFVTAWLMLRGKFRAVARNGEIRLMALVVPLCASLLFMLTARDLYPTLGKGVRVAVFETVTALTTTGFSTVGYGDWNSFGWATLIVLMLIGGGTCSTAGGIKQYRIHLLWKSLIWDLHRRLAPRTDVIETAVWEGDQEIFVSDARLRQIGTFVFLYFLILVLGTAVLTAHGYGLKESLFEFASTIGTVGLSVGVTSQSTPTGVLWTQTTGMLLGRLEFFVLFVSAAKLLRDTRRMLRGGRTGLTPTTR